MLVTRASPFTHTMVSLEIPLLDDPYNYTRYREWADGAGLIQDKLGFLNEDEREFLITGILPGEWDKMFK